MSFGQFIRSRRETAGISLNDFARFIGISPAYWSRIERGIEKPPKDALIAKAANELRLDLDAAFVAAGRLPPDMRDNLEQVVRVWRDCTVKQSYLNGLCSQVSRYEKVADEAKLRACKAEEELRRAKNLIVRLRSENNALKVEKRRFIGVVEATKRHISIAGDANKKWAVTFVKTQLEKARLI